MCVRVVTLVPAGARDVATAVALSVLRAFRVRRAQALSRTAATRLVLPRTVSVVRPTVRAPTLSVSVTRQLVTPLGHATRTRTVPLSDCRTLRGEIVTRGATGRGVTRCSPTTATAAGGPAVPAGGVESTGGGLAAVPYVAA